MRFIMRMIKSILVLVVVIIIVFVIWFKSQMHDWKLFDNEPVQQTQMANGISYTLEDNALFKNIPLSQVKNMFNFMDKGEFMAVTGLTRLGFNDNYLIGQRGSDFILYPFGESKLFVFKSESDLNNELNNLNQNISLQDKSEFIK